MRVTAALSKLEWKRMCMIVCLHVCVYVCCVDMGNEAGRLASVLATFHLFDF